MKKDIELIEVKDVGIAIVPQDPYNPQSNCDVYFINMKDKLIAKLKKDS